MLLLLISTPKTDLKYLEEADAALSNFFELDGFHKLKIAPTIFSYFVDFASYLKEEDIPEKMKGTQPLSVWNFIYPTQVFISRRPTKDEDIYVVLACECEWNKIDGLQLVFRQGKKLTRVSEQDGHVTEADAYDVPDGEDKLLSEF